ncbi:MAG: serine/threonine protein kinase [Candidatus Aminicenantes bacterium]|nr:serine/threonine protein kinase [Candidatus Aminicenantes bacterium]
MMQKIGKYEILEILGKGAMGIVYKAQDPDINREVAIKTIHFEAAYGGGEEEEAHARFMREAQAAGKLSHPNIVTIYDVGREKSLTYIVMRLINGISLQEMIATKSSFPSQEVTHLFTQLCDALDYAHKHGIVHRDIKPANILIDENGQPFILDFGVARIGASTMTQTGKTLGTPSYMSPEQVMGKKIDNRSDIFSLGVVLYEMLTGRRPFDAENITTIIYKIINEEPPPLADIRKDVPAGFADILHKVLAKKVEDRYQTGKELVADLKRLAAPSQETYFMDIPAAASGKKPKRKKTVVVVAVLMCLVAVSMGVLLILSPWKKNVPEISTSVPAETARLEKTFPSDPAAKKPVDKPVDGKTLGDDQTIPDGQSVEDDSPQEHGNQMETMFADENYAGVKRLAQSVLSVSPDDPVAADFLTRAEEKIKESDLAASMRAGIDHYNGGRFQQSLISFQKVLDADKDHAEANRYRTLAQRAISRTEIKTVLERYRKAEQEKNLLLLLQNIGSNAAREQKRLLAVALFNNYDNINSIISDEKFNHINPSRIEVVYANLLTALEKKTQSKKVVFQGEKTLVFEKQETDWKIVEIK